MQKVISEVIVMVCFYIIFITYSSNKKLTENKFKKMNPNLQAFVKKYFIVNSKLTNNACKISSQLHLFTLVNFIFNRGLKSQHPTVFHSWALWAVYIENN